MPSLMHISDLHRSLEEPISNPELLAALERDAARYVDEDPPIPTPEAVVVSGDIVLGALLDDPAFEQKIVDQYEKAEDFLVGLADMFLDGDRSRIVICPGNHDVDWNKSRASMRLVEPDRYPQDIAGALVSPGSRFRWNWSDCSLYEIFDEQAYASRMDEYLAFLKSFYTGIDLLQFPADLEMPLLAELFDRRVLIAAFNSCSQNDCYRRRGEIDAQVASQLHLDLQARGWKYELQIAVWHHNTAGPPHSDDYLNIEQIRTMIDFGFRLGLHGHQHRSEVTAQQMKLPEEQTMTVLSAGSLAAGNPELPRGVNRQYSMLEISEDFHGVRLHLREIETGTQFGARRLNTFGGRSYYETEWTPVRSATGTVVDAPRLNRSQLVIDAEAMVRTGDFQLALDTLAPVAATLDSYGRRLLVEGSEGARNWRLALELTAEAQSHDEVAFRVRAAVELREFDTARKIVQDEGSALGMEMPQRQALLDWISGEEAIG